MNCRLCGEPIKLVPSAAARAASPSNTQGWSAADYTKHFTAHASCELEERERRVRELMK